MDLKSASSSPREEGELEDGEICDDETEENVPFALGDGNRPLRSRRRNIPPLMGLPPQDFRLMPFNHGPHVHGPFPVSHRQQCGPSGPDRPVSPPPLPLPLPPPVHGQPTQRSNFWERSHGALGRFRHGRGDWNRGGNNNRGPIGRYGPAEIHGNKKESPLRKRILSLFCN